MASGDMTFYLTRDFFIQVSRPNKSASDAYVCMSEDCDEKACARTPRKDKVSPEPISTTEIDIKGRHDSDDGKTIKPTTPSSWCARPPKPGYVPCTPFHGALATGDVPYVTRLLDSLDDDRARQYAVTALVDYSCERNTLSQAIVRDGIKDWPDDQRQTIKDFLPRRCTKGHPHTALEFELPTCIAMMSGSFAMVQLLLDRGADIFQTDSHGNTILHALAILGEKERGVKTALALFTELDAFLSDDDDKRKLAFTENKQGLNALDVAAKLGSFEITKAFLNWDNVYRFLLSEQGSFRHYLYDITEYQETFESPKQQKRKMHILQYVTYSTEKTMTRLKRSKYLCSEPVSTWCRAMQEINSPSIVIWLSDWCIYLLLYYISLLTFLHKKGGKPPYGLSVVLLTCSGKFIFNQIVYFVTDFDMWALFFKSLWHSGYPVAFTPFYALVQLLFALCVLTIEILHVSGLSCADNDELFLGIYVFSIVFAFMSLSVFVQLNKQTGHTLIIMDRMLQEAFRFLTLGFIVFMPYAISFFILHSPPNCALHDDHTQPATTMSWVDNNTTDVIDNSTTDVIDNGTTDVILPSFTMGTELPPYENPVIDHSALNGSLCPFPPSTNTPLFTTFAKSCYETLLLAEGIMFPEPIYFDDAISPGLARFYYIFLLVIVGIVLFNLLIALMTDGVSFLNQHKETIQGLQRLSMTKLLKFNSKLGAKYFRKIGSFDRHMTKITNRYYTTTEDRSKVFLHVVEKIPHLQRADKQGK